MSSVSRIITAIRPSLTSSAAAVRTYTTSTTETAAATAASTTSGHYKVTQTRSLIGVPKSTIKGNATRV